MYQHNNSTSNHGCVLLICAPIFREFKITGSFIRRARQTTGTFFSSLFWLSHTEAMNTEVMGPEVQIQDTYFCFKMEETVVIYQGFQLLLAELFVLLLYLKEIAGSFSMVTKKGNPDMGLSLDAHSGLWGDQAYMGDKYNQKMLYDRLHHLQLPMPSLCSIPIIVLSFPSSLMSLVFFLHQIAKFWS